MKGKGIEDYVARASITMVDAMGRIDSNSKGILFIIDENDGLIGSVTDGDIRRWILKTGKLSATVSQVMNPDPKYLLEGDSEKAHAYMREMVINAVPIIKPNRKIVRVIFAKDSQSGKKIKKMSMEGIPIVIMAGGQGTRLYPYTKVLPKPLIPIGDIPIVERIIDRFCEYGGFDYYLTINYKKEMIKSYFSEINPSYQIHCVEETKPMGTAGSIRLIHKRFHTPVVVTNCDILIEADYGDILDYHRKTGNMLTIVSALKNIVVPYGVLHSQEEGIVSAIEEKPQLSYFVNTGMYVMEPDVIEKIPDDSMFHMTDLANCLIKSGMRVGMYPVSEDSFLDMGEFEEMSRMERKLNLKLDN